MGIRSKQLNLPELYEAFDLRYGSAGEMIIATIGETWTKTDKDNYFTQVIDMEGITDDSKLVIQAKTTINETYEETLNRENLFAHIVKIVPGENKLTVYSSKALETAFEIQVLCFN